MCPQSVEGTARLIKKAREAGLTVLLVVGDISSRSMHRLIREGVAEFTPYPDQEGALPEAINRLRLARSTNSAIGVGGAIPVRHGKVITAYGAAGGVGASTFIVNLAWEVATSVRKQGRKVALLDFNFQYGSVATYLDVPRREAVYELVSEAASLDQTGLTQALSTYQDKLYVLTAPRDALPLDIVSPSDVSAIINLAREAFDFVLIDMPQSLMNWSEQVYECLGRVFRADGSRHALGPEHVPVPADAQGRGHAAGQDQVRAEPGPPDDGSVGQGPRAPGRRKPGHRVLLQSARGRKTGHQRLRSGCAAGGGRKIESAAKRDC